MIPIADIATVLQACLRGEGNTDGGIRADSATIGTMVVETFVVLAQLPPEGASLDQIKHMEAPKGFPNLTGDARVAFARRISPGLLDKSALEEGKYKRTPYADQVRYYGCQVGFGPLG